MQYPPLQSGIYELMRDLGVGISDPETLMLGGGNPAILGATQKFLSPILTRVSNDTNFLKRGFQSYSSPRGEEIFIETVVDYFNKMTSWQLRQEHICITQGSQQGLYMLFNYLIGRFNSTTEDTLKPVLVTVKVPDYIGYFDLIPHENFLSVDGKITDHEDGTFSYGIDFPALEALLSEDGKSYRIQSLVISTPNNPSSHVLSQTDANRLCDLAQEYDKLIIFDHAYGFPFPNIIFGEKTVYPFTDNILHCFSFSKIGLPGLRTGIMIGDPHLIEKMSILNGIVNLAPSSYTSALLTEILKSPLFDEYIQNTLAPYYVKKKDNAFRLLREKINSTPVMIHRPEGGFFLWLWAPGFPLTSYQLYEVLKDNSAMNTDEKREKVVVVPGHYFFLNPHRNDTYLRISYTMEEDKVLRGIDIIGDTLKKHYSKSTSKSQ